MKKIILTLATLTTLNAVASNNCVNVSGVYRFEENCTASSYKSDVMLFPHPVTTNSLQMNNILEIEQQSCNSITLKSSQQGADNQTYQTISTFGVTSDEKSVLIQFDHSDLPFKMYKVQALISTTDKGIVLDYKEKSWSLPFNIHGKKLSNTCQLVRIK